MQHFFTRREVGTHHEVGSEVGTHHEVGSEVGTHLILSWPPTSQTVKQMFLYSTVSTLNPEKARPDYRNRFQQAKKNLPKEKKKKNDRRTNLAKNKKPD